MTIMKIGRRKVDPFTFRESVGVQFVPRIEDTVLDDQLSSSVCYSWPQSRAIASRHPKRKNTSSSPPVAPPKEEYRPPTPPKARDKDANSPRRTDEDSNKLLVSPRSRKNKKLELPMSKISEDLESSESSLSSNLSNVLKVTAVRSPVASNKNGVKKLVRFQDEVEENEISKLRRSMLDDLFYASDELANFRYEAFMEEAGLDVNEFM
mmetsp:Transcript_3523/g.5617  ORF Transcript_3523/g.5617 Transcript_3523/m.5617 type:complete len:208 (-) Transcript_3523:980-1603(-)|eukprot:CAMPEP_0178744060 /NCGR_PEP_ID=MMETSP0744-20121128/6544_1 /TAXON_ID=913974 /ORGANISM="Nitzschia punctata, Strain CCMP561" /LENGTH=207 /DNA_ID=CAMNT_0020397119 /DNA_START=76 /DNA_END=699 /DNA_ORIENTATION=+